MHWYKAKSDLSAGTFCFEMIQDAYLYNIPLYYTCTDQGCEKRFSSLCSEDCQVEGQSCFSLACCNSGLVCNGAYICAQDPNITPQN